MILLAIYQNFTICTLLDFTGCPITILVNTLRLNPLNPQNIAGKKWKSSANKCGFLLHIVG